MIEVLTLAQARAVENVIHIEMTSSGFKAWQQGDTLPAHLVVTPPSAAELLAMLRVNAKALIDDQRDEDVRFRAFALAVLDAFNRNSAVTRALFTAIAQATSLANLQTRAAAIQQEPARTVQQLLDAVRAKIDAGDADA